MSWLSTEKKIIWPVFLANILIHLTILYYLQIIYFMLLNLFPSIVSLLVFLNYCHRKNFLINSVKYEHLSFPNSFSDLYFWIKKIFFLRVPGWLSWLKDWLMISSQVMISGWWNQAPWWNVMLGMEPAKNSLSPSPSIPPPFTCLLSFK